MMIVSYCVRLLNLAVLVLLISSTQALASNFRTPKDTMEVMLDAARRADAHLWSTCLTEADRKRYQLLVGTATEKDLLNGKTRTERQYGFPLGENAYEFAMFNTVHDVTHGRRKPGDPKTDSLFNMAYIYQELIWDDRFAEVVLIMPVDGGKGVEAPMTFYFLKENGEWKLFQWMTSRLMLGWIANSEIDYDDLVSFKVLVYTGIAFDRRDCSRMKKREFPVPDTVSKAYKEALDGSAPRFNDALLSLWLLTGDPKAKQYADATNRQSKVQPYFNFFLHRWIPCNPASPKGPREQMRLKYDTAEGWFMAANDDVIALKQLPKKFPLDRPWRAKAHLEAARRIASEGNEELAVKEFNDMIWMYPDQKEQVEEARNEKSRLEEKIKKQASRN
jgi:hypothetical protein